MWHVFLSSLPQGTKEERMLRFQFWFLLSTLKTKVERRNHSKFYPPILHTVPPGSFPEPWVLMPKVLESQLLSIVGSTLWSKSFHGEPHPLFLPAFRKRGGPVGQGTVQTDTCSDIWTPKQHLLGTHVYLVQPASLHSVPFCHSGSVLLSHSISVTVSPPLNMSQQRFQYYFALGDSDTYQ
jgi:hypothetical protein